ncbi:MAG: flap endonuclease-1 [Candidatus Methanomethylicia archaeon]|nr:flap endonuclease-1 [Candidatus Methanomethylicia archaeon]MCX8169317.1 flap endonuclease-1 [Candidatus Methanomethylicia archaeon]MDW7988900.1 flap endonuclease-1 [Nitrososphaerota archaeon]
MGVNLRDIIPREAIEEVELSYFKNKVIAVDGYNALYQFLSTIRQHDGNLLRDSKGRITSHLSGLFYRTVNLLESQIKVVYVFDGKPPELKELEILMRKKRKEEAIKKYEEALKYGDLKMAKIYAQQTAQLTEEMVDTAKNLLDALGVPWIHAPSEGEAQSAYMTQKGDAWAAASQDYDSLLFGTLRLLRNLTISGKRKLPRKEEYIEVKPEIIDTNKILKLLDISREQLIEVAILIGTDYNPDGIEGIGPKTALKLVKQYRDFSKVLEHLGKRAEFPVDPFRMKELFLNPTVTSNYNLVWKKPDKDRVIKILCDEYNFSVERVGKAVDRVLKVYEESSKQATLKKWFK